MRSKGTASTARCLTSAHAQFNMSVSWNAARPLHEARLGFRVCSASRCMSTGVGAGQGPPLDCIGSQQGRGSGCNFGRVTRCGHTCRRHGCSRGAEHAPAYLPRLGICVSASPCAGAWDVPLAADCASSCSSGPRESRFQGCASLDSRPRLSVLG